MCLFQFWAVNVENQYLVLATSENRIRNVQRLLGADLPIPAKVKAVDTGKAFGEALQGQEAVGRLLDMQ